RPLILMPKCHGSQYAAALGVNIDELLLSQPDTGEQGLEIADELVASGAIDI
ncbi:recombinase A, partial [Lacticaseibacillus rhamnosus MTCC 5462]